MTRIITLLDEKNHFLEKFYALNERELENFLKGNFDQLESFYDSREKILEIIKYLDAQIDTAHGRDPEAAQRASSEEKRRIRQALTIKDEYVSRIIEQDLQVLSCIESAKNSIIRELQDLKKGRKAVAGYRSPTFQNRLDEEA